MRIEADSALPHILPLSSGLLKDALLVLGGSLFVALCAQVAVHIPFSPVPITGQTFAVLLAGALLGSRRGALSVLAYLAQGIAGLPVFAGGGSGPFWLLGPTGGYLVGFVATAWVVGWLRDHLGDGSITGTVVILLAGSATTYLFGLLWLIRFVGPDAALMQGLLPFVPGDLIKIALAGLVLSQSPRLTKACGSNIRI
jgi:biotin transport system substrate-specific component